MQEDLSWKEEAQKKASKATRFLVKLIGRSPRSSDETSPSSSESERSEVLKLSVNGKAHRSSQDHTISSSKQNSPPTQKTSKTRANRKSHDSHKLAGPQKVTTSKRGKAKASRTSPESSRSPGLQTEGVSRVGSPELPRGILKPPQSSKALHSPPAANPDLRNTLSTSTDITYSLPVSNLMANTNIKSDTDDQQMPDSSPQMDVMDTRDGVSEPQLTLPLLMANTNVISESQEAEPQTEGTMVNDTPGSKNSEKAESSTPSENTSIGMKIIKFPRLVFGKTAAAGVVLGALPPPSQIVAMNNPLLTQYDKPKAKPTDRSKEEKTNGVASIPEEIGVGAKIKLKIVPNIPTFNTSETSHSVTDGSSVQGKIKDFFKAKLGIQEANKTPPIAKDTKRKGSFTESHKPNQQGVEQARGWDYSRRKASNDQQRHIQAMSESDRLKPRVVTKRRASVYCEDLQQRPNQQTPELDRLKPKDITRRRGTIYSEDLQQRPNLQVTEPEKVPLRPRDISRRRGSISYDEYQKLNQQMPVTTINTEDLEEFLHSLGIDRIEDLATMVTDEPLTDAQVDAFKDVFEQFAENRHGFIHTESLTSSLDRVEISIGPEEVELALEKADYDEDGEVGFQDFLSLMTDNQRFSKCVKAQGADPSQSVEVWETLFYKALTKMLDAGILSTGTTAEIVQYYHQKTLRLIRKAVRPDGEDGGHVLTYYAKGAHLIGLKGKQLMKYMKPVETSAQKVKDSPYLKRPSLHMGAKSSHERRMSLPPAMMVKMGRMKSVKTWKTVKIEDRIRQLSIKHAGMETMEMITPVKIKVNMSMKERDRLTYNEINQIIQKSKSGVKGYLKALSQLKRRDTWNSWGSLQSYCVLHSNKDFPETFTTYSWSWSGCRNMIETGNLDVHSRSFPHNTQGQPLEPIDRKQHTSSNTASHKEKTLATPASRKSRAPNNTSQKSSPPTPAEMESSSTNHTEKKDPTTNTARQLVSPPTPTAKRSNTNANHNDEKYPIPQTSDDFDFDFDYDYDYDYEYDLAPYYVIKKDRPPS